ncbi:retron St85 family RNA-directed DNA polymerase [Pantoea agglomerans]|uniref:retron St85 family RNA-directed DNA polymerase n=1 Tax=Enterobacter agglomerans TaxID=549 RepID=UPI00320A6B13
MIIDLKGELSEKVDDLQQLLKSRPSTHYKVYKIPKRSIGFRLIAQPTKKLKHIQKLIVDLLLNKVKVHKSATAYIKGKNISFNASIHKNSEYLLKLDLENFFNSIKPDMFFKELERQNIRLSNEDTAILEQFCFWNRSKRKNGALVLSVGAPSSPFISNVLMYTFDQELYEFCASKKIAYSRYADDMTFSTKEKNVLLSIHKHVDFLLIKYFSKNLRINDLKVVYSSKAHNRHVTGVTLTNDNEISIGRDKKRLISAMVYNFKNNSLGLDDTHTLQGLIGYAFSIEPDFIKRLQAKYGATILEDINKNLLRT